jgi:3-deoxy-D-manno-octulosonic-acid transferase
VLLQFAPVDTPLAVERFLSHWHPQAAIFMESELWPNLLLASALKGMPLALLNARMSAKSFERWSLPPARSLVAAILLQFSLITPLVVSLISYVL